jgi:transcriptional regulator with XRE-family HTH domain
MALYTIESKRAIPSIDGIAKISKVLGISMSELLD